MKLSLSMKKKRKAKMPEVNQTPPIATETSDPAGEQPPTISPIKSKRPFFRRNILIFAGLFAIAGGYVILHSFAASDEFPLSPYTSRANQIDRFNGGKGLSIYSQPWRGYMETVPAEKLLNGMGVTYNGISDGADDDAVIKTLSESGIHSIRKEIGWGSLNDTETDIEPATKQNLLDIVNTAKKYGVTPLILLNANDGDPQPMASVKATLAQNAASGATSITIQGSPAGLVAGKSGFNTADTPKIWDQKAGAIFKTITQSGGNTLATISRPLPSALSTGTSLNIATFKHLPLYPVGTPEFDNTANAWVNYANIVAKTVASTGIANFDIEIWNELTFGSSFLDINKYYDPALINSPADKFKSGGSAWEMANRTTKALKTTYGSTVKVIWGFSNTNFYNTPSNQLPPQTDGESYHPYHTKADTLANILQGHTGELLGPTGQKNSYVPNLNVSVPEGQAALAWTSLQLIGGKLAPWVRNLGPPGTTNFVHYFTEHGISPSSSNLKDAAQARAVKAKSLLRMYTFWINKGLDKLDVFTAQTDSDAGYGLMGSSNPLAPTPELTALKNMTGQLAGSTSIASPRQLDAEVTATGAQYQTFPGSGSSPALWYRDLFTLLPFQVNDHKFVIADYVMNLSTIASSLPSMDFRVTIKNVNGNNASVSYYDPYLGTTQPITVVAKDANSVTLSLSSTDYPRLITIDEASPPPPGTPSVSLTTPSASATISGVVALNVNIQNISPVSKIEYYVDNQLNGTVAQSPYQFNLDTTKITNAQHALSAKAYNSAGQATASDPINVTINNAITPKPSISLTAPSAGATVSGKQVALSSLIQNMLAVAQVIYSVDGHAVATLTNSPYQSTWNSTTVANGAHTITAQAQSKDIPAVTVTSAAVIVTVNNASKSSVTITSPNAGSKVSEKTNIAVSIKNINGVSKVDYYLDTQFIGSSSSAPSYTFIWNTRKFANGQHVLMAQAVDGSGKVTVSPAISISVDNVAKKGLSGIVQKVLNFFNF